MEVTLEAGHAWRFVSSASCTVVYSTARASLTRSAMMAEQLLHHCSIVVSAWRLAPQLICFVEKRGVLCKKRHALIHDYHDSVIFPTHRSGRQGWQPRAVSSRIVSVSAPPSKHSVNRDMRGKAGKPRPLEPTKPMRHHGRQSQPRITNSIFMENHSMLCRMQANP